MTDTNLFNNEIIQKTKSSKEALIVKSVQIGETTNENELVFFIKPELFKVKDDTKILNSLKMIEGKFKEFDVKIKGAAIIPGATLEEFEIMNRHYGFINQLSRMASEIVDDETRGRLFEIMGEEDTGEHLILGGHEFINEFNADLETLSDNWFGQEASKLRSGFYFVNINYQNKPILLVNGFHPSQLRHFTREDHRILLMLLHTDTDWYDMKFDLVGDTFPDRAKLDSIRGLLYANPDRYGLESVSINTNGVHLSAGPFEAAFEVTNFFGPIQNLDPAQTQPLAIKRSIDAGITKEQALSLLENPNLHDSDLFSKTENLNTDAAVKLAKDSLTEN